ncbi:phosphoenolpyruvate mutase [Burkholderia cenocepacia]|nr:phosphoenolpyruvate mutase [Burkholderia cenocepacia]RQV91680.1 phosphoenolpyruvate mutase [Burkholderia cenocepacia]
MDADSGASSNTECDGEGTRPRPVVYVAMCADVFHDGHVNVLHHASTYGDVIVGLMTDEAIASYKRMPLFSFEQRRAVVASSVWVKDVVPQTTLDFRPNLRELRPEFVVHGDDWREGAQRDTRAQVVEVLREWSGTLIEIPYTHGVSSTYAQQRIRRNGIAPSARQARLRHALRVRPLIRVLEAHSPLAALIVERAQVRDGGGVREFDAIWSSSLTDSTVRGKPDIEVVDLSMRLQTINEMFDVTTKPLVYDADSGGLPEHFVFTVRALERVGVSAVVIEDKVGLKRNSLSSGVSAQSQSDIAEFCEKIAAGKDAQVDDAFMIVARIESFILGAGIDDALQRAHAYAQAGADAVLIHSRNHQPVEVLDFCRAFRLADARTPIFAIPSTYDIVSEHDLEVAGVNGVIYANHLLRAAYPAMTAAAESILRHGRAHECARAGASLHDILSVVAGNVADAGARADATPRTGETV